MLLASKLFLQMLIKVQVGSTATTYDTYKTLASQIVSQRISYTTSNTKAKVVVAALEVKKSKKKRSSFDFFFDFFTCNAATTNFVFALDVVR